MLNFYFFARYPYLAVYFSVFLCVSLYLSIRLSLCLYNLLTEKKKSQHAEN